MVFTIIYHGIYHMTIIYHYTPKNGRYIHGILNQFPPLISQNWHPGPSKVPGATQREQTRQRGGQKHQGPLLQEFGSGGIPWGIWIAQRELIVNKMMVK